MAPLFTLRGYTAFDPLDNVPAGKRYMLTAAVYTLATIALVYIISTAAPAVIFQSVWVMAAEVALFGLISSAVMLVLRKCSSIVLYLIVLIPLMVLDFYLETHFRQLGKPALWVYYPGSFIWDIQPMVLRFFLTQSVDALLIGPVCIWIARIVAGAIYGFSPKEIPTPGGASPFPDDWSKESLVKPVRDAGYWILRLLGFGYLGYLLVLVVGAFGSTPFPTEVRGLIDMTYKNPALAMNTFGKVGVMVLLAFAGAYNTKLRWHATLVMAIGHAISTMASLGFYAIDAPGSEYRDFLLTSAIVDGVMVALFIYILIRWKGEAANFARPQDFPDYYSLPSFLSKWFFYLIMSGSWLMVIAALYFRLVKSGSVFDAVYGYPDPILANTITCYGTMGLIALLLATRERLRDHFTGILLFPLAAGAFACVCWFLVHPSILIEVSGSEPVEFDQYFVAYLAGNSIIAAALITFRRMYYRVEYLVTTLHPSDARNASAVYDALYGVTPEDAALAVQRIDRFAGDIRGRIRGLINFPFWIVENVLPLVFGIHPSFSNMSRDERRYFLRKYLISPPAEQRASLTPALAGLSFKLGVSVHALTTLAHYSTIKTWSKVGYILPDARDRLQPDVPAGEPPFASASPLPLDEKSDLNFQPSSPASSPRPLAKRLVTPVSRPEIPEEADYIVIGSGAGGATMAYRLAQGAGNPSRILVVERGGRYSPLQDMNDNELEMIPKLYKEGGLQQTKNFDMMVLQGEAVGGTTVINNAVCFEMGGLAAQEWERDYGINTIALRNEYTIIKRELGIARLPANAVNTRVRQVFMQGVGGYNDSLPPGEHLIPHDPLFVNAYEPAGDGLWNLGNKRMQKRTMLESYIPWAEARGVRVVSDTSAVRYIMDKNGSAGSVLLRTNTGDLKSVRVKKAVIVAGGCISSTHFLMRSEVAGEVGKNLAGNFAFPVAFEFNEELCAFDGTQINTGALDPKERAVFETYYNPPAAMALSLPFFFQKSEYLMNRYRYCLNFGALVGSLPGGVIQQKADPLNGRAFTWALGGRDKERIRYAFETLAWMGLLAGAKQMILPTRPGLAVELTKANVEIFIDGLARFPMSLETLVLATAHPQGGNRMSAAGGVVDTAFRVRGTRNVFVADASIFPTSIGVNPQLTIMALSSLAAAEALKL